MNTDLGTVIVNVRDTSSSATSSERERVMNRSRFSRSPFDRSSSQYSHQPSWLLSGSGSNDLPMVVPRESGSSEAAWA